MERSGADGELRTWRRRRRRRNLGKASRRRLRCRRRHCQCHRMEDLAIQWFYNLEKSQRRPRLKLGTAEEEETPTDRQTDGRTKRPGERASERVRRELQRRGRKSQKAASASASASTFSLSVLPPESGVDVVRLVVWKEGMKEGSMDGWHKTRTRRRRRRRG